MENKSRSGLGELPHHHRPRKAQHQCRKRCSSGSRCCGFTQAAIPHAAPTAATEGPHPGFSQEGQRDAIPTSSFLASRYSSPPAGSRSGCYSSSLAAFERSLTQANRASTARHDPRSVRHTHCSWKLDSMHTPTGCQCLPVPVRVGTHTNQPLNRSNVHDTDLM